MPSTVFNVTLIVCLYLVITLEQIEVCLVSIHIFVNAIMII